MIHIDPPELAEPRRRRCVGALDTLGLDGWLLTTARAVRMASGAWSDQTDFAGEYARPILSAGDTVLEATYPPDDPRLIDEVADMLPTRGRIAVDRLGLAAIQQLRKVRPDLEIEDASMFLGAAQGPKSLVEMEALKEGHRRTEAALLEMLPDVTAGVTERELNQKFAATATRHGLSHIHVDTVFSVLPKDPEKVDWHRGEWEGAYPYRELTGERELEAGDHVAFDAGFLYRGYMTDVGWTLLVDRDPTSEEEKLADTWREVAVRVAATLVPGAKASAGREAALRTRPADEPLPWPKGLYVAHGIGLCGVEGPLIGADFPPEMEEAMEITPGQTFLVEPYIHRTGIGGFRSEYAVQVGDDGPHVVNSIDVGYWPTDPRSQSAPSLP